MRLEWLLIRAFCKRFYFLFTGLERKMVEKFSEQEPVYTPLFIIGPPRSGSTIFYQAITNALNVTYISNLVEACRELPMLGFWLHNIFFDSRAHNSFNSNYGKTIRFYEPAESIMWLNWIRTKEHYVLPENIPHENKIAFKKLFKAVLNKYSRPWVVENLAFGMRLKLIKEIFLISKIFSM